MTTVQLISTSPTRRLLVTSQLTSAGAAVTPDGPVAVRTDGPCSRAPHPTVCLGNPDCTDGCVVALSGGTDPSVLLNAIAMAITNDDDTNPAALSMLYHELGEAADTVVGTFLSRLPERRSRVAAAVASGRAPAVQAAAHACKAVSASVGLSGLAAAAARLEANPHDEECGVRLLAALDRAADSLNALVQARTTA